MRYVTMMLLSLFVPLCCFGQMMQNNNQYGRQGSMQNSAEMQNFKAQQEQKQQAYLAQYDKANQDFISKAMAMPKEQKIQAFKDFFNEQYKKNCAFRKDMHDSWRAFMLKQLDKNPYIQQAMKDQMLARIDQDYADAQKFYATKISEDMQFLDELLQDKSIDGQELNKKLQEFFQSQGKSGREFAAGQQQKYRQGQMQSGSAQGNSWGNR